MRSPIRLHNMMANDAQGLLLYLSSHPSLRGVLTSDVATKILYAFSISRRTVHVAPDCEPVFLWVSGTGNLDSRHFPKS
jgi:hypothetical protein